MKEQDTTEDAILACVGKMATLSEDNSRGVAAPVSHGESVAASARELEASLRTFRIRPLPAREEWPVLRLRPFFPVLPQRGLSAMRASMKVLIAHIDSWLITPSHGGMCRTSSTRLPLRTDFMK